MKGVDIMSKVSRSILSISVVTLLVIAILGVSYAFFTANLSGNETASTLIVTGGRMQIAFSGGNSIEINNVYPRDDAWTTKTFTVKGTNTTDANMNYKLTLVVEENSFSDDALSFSLTSYNSGNNGSPVSSIANRTIKSGASNIELGNGHFVNANEKIHTYGLSIFFFSTSANQNNDQNKYFSSHVEIEGVQ